MSPDGERPDRALDVPSLMADVRARVARKREQGAYGEPPFDPAKIPLEFESPLDRLAASAEVRGRRESMAPKRGVVDVPVSLGRRAVVKLISPFLGDIVSQVNDFHVETATQLRRLSNRIEKLDERLTALEKPARSSQPDRERTSADSKF